MFFSKGVKQGAYLTLVFGVSGSVSHTVQTSVVISGPCLHKGSLETQSFPGANFVVTGGAASDGKIGTRITFRAWECHCADKGSALYNDMRRQKGSQDSFTVTGDLEEAVKLIAINSSSDYKVVILTTFRFQCNALYRGLRIFTYAVYETSLCIVKGVNVLF